MFYCVGEMREPRRQSLPGIRKELGRRAFSFYGRLDIDAGMERPYRWNDAATPARVTENGVVSVPAGT